MAREDPNLDFQVQIFKIDRTATVKETAIRYGALALLALFAWLSIQDLAGKRTFADIGIRFMADFKVSEGVAYLFGGGGVAYGLGERRLRRNRTATLTARITQLENDADPDRTSSLLTPHGTTRKGD
jgi:hypothetical protein